MTPRSGSMEIFVQQHGNKLISIVIPVYNEEKNVERAYNEVCRVFEGELVAAYDFEIIFTDNHSEDGTYQIISTIAEVDNRVRAVRFSQNFGFNRSLLTGYKLARGDAAIQLDCDLQDPPSLFSNFIAEWERGGDVVVGIRTQRPESRLILAMRKVFYRLLAKVSDDELTIDGGDFRLVDRSVLDRLKKNNEATPYVRGLITSLAAHQVEVEYVRNQRIAGESKFPVRRLIALAVDGFLSHSVVPLRIATYVGLFVACTTLLMAVIYMAFRWFVGGGWPSGFATQVTIELLGISLNALFLGIMGEYIGRIHMQLKNRPLTIPESSINIERLELESIG